MSKFRYFLFFCLFLASALAISAQSAVFNIPSTDVVSEGRFYVEADFISHFDGYRNGGYQTYGYRTVYGFKRKVEVGANFYYTRGGADASPKEFQPTVKWKTLENEKFGVASSIGTIISVPLNKSAGGRTFAVFYSNVSKTFNRANGMRLTGGFYKVVGAERDFGTKKGVILGVEQPIKGKLSFAADWFSGKNRLGYSAAGFNYAISEKQFVFLGYNFGNFGRGNNAFSAFYGYTF